MSRTLAIDGYHELCLLHLFFMYFQFFSFFFFFIALPLSPLSRAPPITSLFTSPKKKNTSLFLQIY